MTTGFTRWMRNRERSCGRLSCDSALALLQPSQMGSSWSAPGMSECMRWTLQQAGWCGTSGLAAAVTTSVAAAGESAYFSSEDGYLYSVASSDGSLIWRYQIEDGIGSTPEVEAGLVYVGSDNGNIYALDSDTGSLVWSSQASGDVKMPILVHDDLVLCRLG